MRDEALGRFAVYFDGSCPMCLSEIAFYQKRRGADQIDWVDVSEPAHAPDDLSCDAAMARFHVRRRDGQLVDGGAAFAELWRQLPAFKWLGVALIYPPGRWIANLAYNLFLPIRPKLQRWAVNRAAQKH